MTLPQRTKRALDLKVAPVSDGHWTVQSGSDPDKWYDVFIDGIDEYECDCPDYQHRGAVCKHIRASALFAAKDT